MSGEADGVEDIRTLAERYRLVVQRSNRWHYVAAERAEARGRMLGIASAALGAVVGTFDLCNHSIITISGLADYSRNSCH